MDVKRPRHRSPVLSLLLAVATVVGAGCGSETEPGGPDVSGQPASDPPSSEPPPSDPTPSDPTAEPTGFPCAVRAVLQDHCATCHVEHLYYGPDFRSRDDLLRPARELFLVNADKVGPGTFGEHVATALRDGAMPPYGATSLPSAAERALVIDWVAAGMPAGDCGELTRVP